MYRQKAILFSLVLCTALVWSVPPVSADVEVRFFAEGDLVLGAYVAVLAEDPVYRAEKLAPPPDGIYWIGADPGSKVTFHLQSATTEYAPLSVVIPGNLVDVMDIDIVVRQANDTCEDAPVLAVSSVTPGTTIGATDDPDANQCGTEISAPGVWYRVVGTGTTMTASTCNDGNPDTGSADYDSKLNVYCPDCSLLNCVAGNDDGPGCLGFSSQVSWCAMHDIEYQILVQGFFGATGNFELAVYDNGFACNDAVPCLPPPQVGACCNCLPPPFNCTEGTIDECAAVQGDFVGDGSTCMVIDNQSSPNLEIPDGAGVFVCNTIDVADSLVINDVNVLMTITHTWIGDLEVAVEHDATLLTLWQRQCGSTDNINSTADDEYNSLDCAEIAAGPMLDVRWPPAIGGLGPLSVYDGMDAVGPWTMCAADFVFLDSGTLDYWALQFNDEAFPSICDDQGELVGFCHCPPGHDVHDETGACIENDHCRTIDVADAAIPAHLANHACDYLGPCVGGDDD